MMSLIGEEPVMWVNVKSLLSSGPYAEQNMRAWNEALLQACGEYPNMRVFDWAALAKKTWFIDDGIHYTTPGYAARSRLIAQALARAFPAVGASSGCVVE
jgi:lysophospholipase L1-like esterase